MSSLHVTMSPSELTFAVQVAHHREPQHIHGPSFVMCVVSSSHMTTRLVEVHPTKTTLVSGKFCVTKSLPQHFSSFSRLYISSGVHRE